MGTKFVITLYLLLSICIFDGISNETGKLHIIHTRAQWLTNKSWIYAAILFAFLGIYAAIFD